jgi:hypothetical protein
MDIFNACKSETMPSIQTMSRYGLTGYQGTNPVAVFDCYKRAVKYDKVTAQQLEESKNLNDLILKSPSVMESPFYDSVIQLGGIKVPPTFFECLTCGFQQDKHETCRCCGI